MESANKNEIEVPKGSVTCELQTVDFLSHVSHDEMTTTECQTFPDVCSGSPKLKETFLHIRNHLIHLWLENREILSVGETVIHQSIEAPYNGDVNLINRIHEFLKRQGYLNLCTKSSENENVMIVEDEVERESSGKIEIVDKEILNPLVDKELPAEDESQFITEEETEEDSELRTDSVQEDLAGLITEPERVASAIECPSFSDIPSESRQSAEKCLNNYLILTHIFQFLPLCSRNQIRFVCRRWNEACNQLIIAKNEVLAIPAPYQRFMGDVFSTLTESKRRIINLNFQWRDQSLFNDFVSKNFWQQHGFKIRYLVFPSGDLEADDIVQVLKCCSNLEELRIPEMPARTELNVWAKLLDNRLVFNKMTTLYFRSEMNLERESSSMNKAFSKIFPNIQAVEIVYSQLESEELRIQWPGKRRSFINSSRREMHGLMNAVVPLSLKLQSFKLRFDMCNHVKRFWEPVKDVVAAVNHQIKTLKVPLRYFIERKNISDLRRLENLTSLTLTDLEKYTSRDPINRDILIAVLDSVPELRHIALHFEHYVITDKYLTLNRIISSKLKSLLVSAFEYVDLATGDTRADCNVFNDTLQSLNIKFRCADNFKITYDMALFLVENCRNLKAIKLDGPGLTTKMLKNLFIHHEYLRGLSATLHYFQLKRSMGCHESIEKGPKQLYSFCRFQYLEHLILTIPVQLRLHEKYSFSNLMLPQLKCLEVTFVPYHSEYETRHSYEYKNLSAFLYAVEEMPRLEYFSLDYWNNVPYSLFLGQCESHKSLKYLFFHCARPKVENSEFLKHEYAFEVCPSLRCIQYGEKTLFRNSITKEIQPLFGTERSKLIEKSSFYWPRY